MDLQHQINSAENLYRQKLEGFFKNIFRDKNLSSHGLEHHRRVWLYCRELISYPEIIISITDKSLPVKLIIAAYLHDSGMTVDPGPQHGHLSRFFCEQFLKENDLGITRFSDVLEAIENHDNKDYSLDSNAPPLLTILSVADDLDALGYTGIFRYLEIYIARQIPFEELGEKIKNNVTNRFGNLIRKFGHIKGLIERESLRFEIISGFCSNYNNQLIGYKFGTGNPSGCCGVAEVINNMLLEKTDLKGITYSSNWIKDPVINSYLQEFIKENI